MARAIYKAALSATFGRGSARPFRSALFRLAGVAAGSLFLGLVLAENVRHLPVTALGSERQIALAEVLVLQAGLLLVLFAAAGTLRAGNAFQRLLFVWPVSNTLRWRIHCLPGTILASLSFTLIGPSLITMAHTAGLSHVAAFICGLVALIAAVASFYGAPIRPFWAPALYAPAVIGLEYFFVRLCARNSIVGWLASLGFCLLMAGVFVAFCYAAKNPLILPRPDRSKTVHTAWLPASLWFMKKIVRNPVSRLGLATTLMLSVGLGILMRGAPGGSAGTMLIASLLAATFASDIRSLARRHNPAEITALRGTRYFLSMETGAASVWGVAIALPLTLGGPPLSAYDISQFAAGLGVGLLAGTLIVPVAHDVTSQCVATLFRIGLLVIPFQAPWLASSQERTTLVLICFTAVTCLASFVIEYKRNAFRWRVYATQNTRTTI